MSEQKWKNGKLID